MKKIWSVFLESEWRCTHPYEFESEEQAEEFLELVHNGDLGAIIDYGDFSPDHTAELIDFNANGIREGIL